MEHLRPSRIDYLPTSPAAPPPTVGGVCVRERPNARVRRAFGPINRARNRGWILQIERRHPEFIDPLMGWTGSDDPAADVCISFPTAKAAARFAERQGWTCRIEADFSREALAAARASREAERRERELRNFLENYLHIAWMQTQYGLGGPGVPTDLNRALVNPASVYAAPSDVAADPALTAAQKRAILERWAWDERLLELATDEAMPEGEPSRLDEVGRALIAVEEEENRGTLVVVAGDRRRNGI